MSHANGVSTKLSGNEIEWNFVLGKSKSHRYIYATIIYPFFHAAEKNNNKNNDDDEDTRLAYLHVEN